MKLISRGVFICVKVYANSGCLNVKYMVWNLKLKFPLLLEELQIQTAVLLDEILAIG